MSVRFAKEFQATNMKNMNVKKYIQYSVIPYLFRALLFFLCAFMIFIMAHIITEPWAMEETIGIVYYIFLIVPPGILVLIGLFYLALWLKRKDFKELKNCFKLYNLSYEALEADMTRAVTGYDYVLFGERLLVCIAYEAIAVPYERLVWAYLKQEKRGVYIYAYTDDGYMRKIRVSNVQCGAVILRKMAEFAPHMIFGDTYENVNMYQSDFHRMIEVVQQRKENCAAYGENNISGRSMEENYVIKNEYVVTWERYRECYIDCLISGGIWFKVLWGILAFNAFIVSFENGFSFIPFLFAMYCVYRIFIRDYIKLQKRYKQNMQQCGGNWIVEVWVSDTSICIKELGKETCYNIEDVVAVKEKKNRISLVMNGRTMVRMYKSAFVEGSWEECKKMLHKG
ncbi:MAG: DUF6709 family protein [Agathobacter sp.]